MHRVALAVLGCAVAVALAACSSGSTGKPVSDSKSPSSNVLLDERFQGQPAGRWLDGEVHGAWRAVYDGLGATSVTDGSQPFLTLAPQPATSAETTHAALVVTQDRFGDVDVTTRLRTVRQLRGRPHDWEVAWLLWHYTDDQHFYYLTLKPSGWELGKEDPGYPGAQRFLRTRAKPVFALGRKHTVRVRQVGSTMTVWGDGRLLGTFTDTERPYVAGSIGLYTEDAEVAFDRVLVRRP